MTQLQNNKRTAPLLIPLLQQEQDPTATDMRKIQSWGATVPATLFNAISIGAYPPANLQLVQVFDSITATTDGSGNLTITFLTQYGFNFAYGYIPYATPGDDTNTLISTVCLAGSSDLTKLLIHCYGTGGVITSNTVTVNIQLIGA
jgi:hypothetical protein